MTYRIGTRSSRLALAQAQLVRERLEAAYPGDVFETVTVETAGDRDRASPVAALGAGAFVKAIEKRLLEGDVDLAVHSMKDMPVGTPPGLTLAKAWRRGDARDALVAGAGLLTLAELPRGAKVATGSARRGALLLRLRPDLEILPLRGNVETRLRKLFEPRPGEPRLDAVVLAAAGLERLGRTGVIGEYFDPAVVIPAANQGQLAIELRAADTGLKAKIDALGDDLSETFAVLERDFLVERGADCSRPTGAWATIERGLLTLHGVDGGGRGLEFFRRTAGEVILVGAGPGDPGLITVKGRAAIAAADCIVYDRLVAEELLDAAPPGCERIYAGKASGEHALGQDEINLALLRAAMRHGRVVRLKGGDPFVFGRGGEEMEYLAARGVPVSAVPGVSAAVAAAESAGIPVTRRGVASGFEVTTAHPGGERRPNTRVVLMGSDRIADVAAELMRGGMSAATPAAVVAAATTAASRCVVGTLGDIAGRAAGIKPPATLIAGGVVALRAKNGFPLSGGRYLLPVIEGGSTALAERVRALGGEVDEITVGRIAPVRGAFTERDLEGVSRVVVTSRNGLAAAGGEMAEALRRRGIPVEYVRRVTPRPGTLHLTQPDAGRVEGVRSIDVYRNEEVPVGGTVDLAGYDAVLFTCASSARRLLRVAKGRTTAVAIGPKTAAAAAALDVVTAAEPTAESMIERLIDGRRV